MCFRTIIPLLLGVFCQFSFAIADDLYLAHGGRVEGAVQDKPGEFRLDSPFSGRLVLAAEQVERVVEKSDLQRRYEALLPSIPDTEAGHLDMAERCLKAGLADQRSFHLEQVLRHNPDNVAARHALGFSLVDDRWIRQDQYMEEQGYIRYRGGWRLPQEIKLLKEKEAYDAAVISWKKKIKTWRTWIVKGRENSGVGGAEIRAIRDPLAAPTLAALLDNEKEPRPLRLLYVEVLGQLPSGDAVAALIKHSLQEGDPKVRDACLDQLERIRAPLATSAFINALEHDKNWMINRAAVALGRIKDPAATLPLINALVTEHKQVIVRGGGVTPTFSNQGGGLSAGSKTEVKRIHQQNESVLRALIALHPGINYQYNQVAWKTWYIAQKAPPPEHLRRSD